MDPYLSTSAPRGYGVEWRPPSGFVRDLRRLIRESSAWIEFDHEKTLEKGKGVPIWNVMYLEGRQRIPSLIIEWKGLLDGNLNAIVREVQKYDLANGRQTFREYARGLEDLEDGVARRRKARRLDDFTQRAAYLRKGISAIRAGKPDMRSYWSVPSWPG